MRNNIKLVPKMLTPATLGIWAVLPDGDNRQIAQIDLPNDMQMNDNLECAEAVCAALRKRIRKSV